MHFLSRLAGRVVAWLTAERHADDADRAHCWRILSLAVTAEERLDAVDALRASGYPYWVIEETLDLAVPLVCPAERAAFGLWREWERVT